MTLRAERVTRHLAEILVLATIALFLFAARAAYGATSITQVIRGQDANGTFIKVRADGVRGDGGSTIVLSHVPASDMWQEAHTFWNQGGNCTRPKPIPQPLRWVCTIYVDRAPRFAAQVMQVGENSTVVPEADLSCRLDGGLGCPECLLPTAAPPLPAIPKTLTASTAPTSQMVTLGWAVPVVPNQEYFLIERSANAGVTWTVQGRSVPTTYQDAGAAATPYLYRVKAVNVTGTSAGAFPVSAVTGLSTLTIPAAPSGLVATAGPALPGGCP